MTTRINKRTALLIGAGYTARALVPALLARGIRVVVTTRNGTCDLEGVRCLTFDGTASPELGQAFKAADIILSSIPPDRGTGEDAALRAFGHLETKASWIGYLSATSVYGDRDGGWAFEAEWPTPGLGRGRHRAEAELGWLETGWPAHIFRLAGIYGPGRLPFAKLRNGTARAVIKSGHIVNRIHVADIVSVVLASIDTPGQPYRFGDDEMFTTTVNGSGKAGEFYQNTTEYDVVFYDQPAGLRRTAASYTPVSDPRDVAFISLNGETRPADWQNCERTHRGYLYASDSILRLSPMFEVCMRNKGYVLTTELGVSSSQGLTAASAGQSRQFTPYTPAQTYTYPSL